MNQYWIIDPVRSISNLLSNLWLQLTRGDYSTGDASADWNHLQQDLYKNLEYTVLKASDVKAEVDAQVSAATAGLMAQKTEMETQLNEQNRLLSEKAETLESALIAYKSGKLSAGTQAGVRIFQDVLPSGGLAEPPDPDSMIPILIFAAGAYYIIFGRK